MIQLRPYQEAAIEGVRSAIRGQIQAGRAPSVILESPTGSGKTAMAAFMAQRNLTKPKGSVAFVVHRRELVDQTALTFEKVGLDFGFIASGYPRKRARIQICSVGTLANRIDVIEAPNLVVWDECHHVGAKTWADIRHAWASATHVGLTATPTRLDGKGLGAWFNEIVPGPRVSDLMAEGFLSTYDAYAPVDPSMKGIHKRGGDYARNELESALDTGEILGGIVEKWRELAAGKRTIGFAISVKHSEDIVARFQEAGIPSTHLDAQTPKEERRAKLRAFARGEIQVLWNVELFGEGFDLAANSGMDVNIEAVILARPTASLGLHLQQIGRALRPKPEPAIILDHAGNVLRHGFPDDPREWSLEDQEVKQGDTAGPKTCPSCFGLVPRHLMVCRLCGFVWPPSEGRQVAEVRGELVQLVSGAETAEQLQLELQRRRAKAGSLESLRRVEASRGLPAGWADAVWAAQQQSGTPRRRL